LSYGQNFGFLEFKGKNINDKYLPKNSCPETKYAEAIVKTGKQFLSK